MKVPLDFDSMDFMRFIWYYDRLQKQKKRESKNNSGEMDLSDIVERFRQG